MTSIKYISHGAQLTGGYLHEKHLAQNLAEHINATYTESRQWQYYETKKAHLNLLKWAYKESTASIQICVSRLALPIIFKNLFSNRKTLVIWHYYDDKDRKSKWLKNYYHLLVQTALFIAPKKLAFVAVAPFWKSYFEKEFKLKQVFYFPNLFDPKTYANLSLVKVEKQIHLGQVSFKNSAELFLLAELLFHKGYTCYFSTNDPKKVYQSKFYEVIYFENHTDFLNKMAESAYTLTMPAIAEGWNRIAHESLLVGTQVIGFNKGGLGDLLRGANALVVGTKPVNNQIEAFTLREFGSTPPPPSVVNALYIITNNITSAINQNFLNQFTTNQTSSYLEEISTWCKS